MSITFRAWDPALDAFVAAGDFEGVRANRPADMAAVEANFHNSGALDTLTLLGLPVDHCGRIPAADLPEVRRAIIRARNLPGRRAPFVHDAETAGRVHWGGQPDHLILHRLEQLDAVVAHCVAHGWNLSWA